MKFQRGFTLLELLTVIAIIAVLSAIIFPVFARAKDQAYRSSDMTNMNALRTALQLYKADQSAFPPRLLGYATGYSDVIPSADDIVPADRVVGALFPKRVESPDTFKPAYDRSDQGALARQFMTAVWPTGEIVGGAGQAGQRFGPDTTVKRAVNSDELALFGNTTDPCKTSDAFFYKQSGYDAATVPGRNELRYTLFWTGWSVPADPCNPDADTEMGSSSDNPRQLGYADPPDDTVVTWDSYFREYSNTGSGDPAKPDRTKRDIVLFVGGSARPYDSQAVYEHAYQVKP